MGCGSGNPINPPVQEETGRTVFCVKFQKEMPGLKEVPFEGHPLGRRSTRTYRRSLEDVGRDMKMLW